jgi:hypothetical protein
MLRCIFALILCAAVAPCCGPRVASAGDPVPGEFVTVHLRDGRRVAGWLTTPNRPDYLSVRAGGPGLWLTSHFPLPLVESVAAAPPPQPQPLPQLPSPPMGGPHPSPPVSGPPLPMLDPPGPPRSIRLHAEPVNTDGDADADSLRVVVLPLDVRSRPTAAGGQLNVALIEAATEHREDRPPLFRAEWSRELRAADFTPDGYVVDLPLRTPLPASSVVRPRVFEVEGALSVPGSGRLEATQMLLPLVPPSLGILRDRIVPP